MDKEKDDDKYFKPYTEDYIESLLNIVNKDVQSNTPMSDESYLKVALKACEKFNEAFGDNLFDVGEQGSDR